MRQVRSESGPVKSDAYDIEVERGVLAGVLKHQSEVYFDVAAIVNERSFYLPEHKLVWSAIKKAFEEQGKDSVDRASLLYIIRCIDSSVIDKYAINDLLDICDHIAIALDSTVEFARKVARYYLIRDLDFRLSQAQNKLRQTTPDKTILDIFGSVEKEVFDFQQSLLQSDNDTKIIAHGVDEWYATFYQHDIINRGIPTGFPIYDKAIGGGIRAPGVAVIGARPKTGKTAMALNIAKNVAVRNIPVLYLDTEMTYGTMLTKLVANISSTEIETIETGQFKKDIFAKNGVENAVKVVKSVPFYYRNVSGFSHYQIISAIRQWISRHVGFENGQTKECLVILDYIKTMNLGELGDHQEYQYLGQYLTDLHNFGVQYNLPILAMVQLNRDGVDLEGSKAVAGSDRIIWLCTSFSILKKKNEVDEVVDSRANGDRKLVVCDVRYGPGMPPNEYINIKTDLGKCQMFEGDTSIQTRQKQGTYTPPTPRKKKDKADSANDDNETSLAM
jgi:replicative DNA helicase